ncbi:MAG TPA: hypothetical protein VGK54_03775 [Chloroflexota bacterium]
MIVRIVGEAQYRVPDNERDHLNQLDDAVVAAVTANDEAKFKAGYDALLTEVRTKGSTLPATDLSTSDIALPHPDLTLAEAKSIFVGAGLIPN